MSYFGILLPNTAYTWTGGIATHFIFIYDFINNTLKHEIQIDNLKNLHKMLSSENNFSGIT
jgi:hypothetical protein